MENQRKKDGGFGKSKTLKYGVHFILGVDFL